MGIGPRNNLTAIPAAEGAAYCSMLCNAFMGRGHGIPGDMVSPGHATRSCCGGRGVSAPLSRSSHTCFSPLAALALSLPQAPLAEREGLDCLWFHRKRSNHHHHPSASPDFRIPQSRGFPKGHQEHGKVQGKV